MRPLTTLILFSPSLTTAHLLDPSTLHPPGTPMTQYSPSGSILHPSPPYRPWLTTPSDSGRDSDRFNNHNNNRDSPQPAWYRPHPHASYHNTTYYLNEDAMPQQFKPEPSEFDDPKYVASFLDEVEKEQERGFLMSQVDDLDSLPLGAKICLVLAGVLFVYLLLDAAAGALARWWLDSSEASEKRKQERGRRIVRPWWERYSFVGAVERWVEMTRVQMGINEGGPNSLFPAKQPQPAIEVPMMRRSVETTAVTRRVETVRTQQQVPYTPQETARMVAEINQLSAHQEMAPPRRLFSGMPGSPLWVANQARRAFRSKG